MSSQSIIENKHDQVVNDLDASILKSSTELLKYIRFSIGKGVSFKQQFNSLLLREILGNGVCSLLKNERQDLLDKLRSDLILNKEEYL